MPRIVTREGFLFHIPVDFVRAGRFEAPVVQPDGSNVMRRFTYDHIWDRWEMERTFEEAQAIVNPAWVAAGLPAPVEYAPDDFYRDGFQAPEFFGWEVVKNPHEAREGDVYVCVNPQQGRDYRLFQTPNASLASEHGRFDPQLAGAALSRGFRIYRRKRMMGPVRLLLNSKFSEPLPIP